MAIYLSNGVVVTLNSVALSDHVTMATINRAFDELEVTAMGDSGHKFVKGLESSTVTIDFLNDTAAASVLATLQTAYGTTVAFSAIQDTTSPVTVSATNKLYTGTILVDNITDINGAVGDEGMLDITFTCNSKTVVATTGTF